MEDPRLPNEVSVGDSNRKIRRYRFTAWNTRTIGSCDQETVCAWMAGVVGPARLESSPRPDLAVAVPSEATELG